MSDPAIEARGLTKSYGSIKAVDGIDLVVERGHIYGLLGPNGAGKTTTILMLLGLTESTSGTVSVLGHDPLREPLQVKRRVGYMPDSVGFYDNLTAYENLRYSARLAGIPRGEIEKRIIDGLEWVRLADVAERNVGGFSHGMRQRLGLAELIMKQAEVAILDEPTSGLDPQSTHELLDMIRDLKGSGVTVLLSSHLLDQVQSVCDHVLLFHSGKIALQGTLEELASEVLGGGYAIHVEAEGTDIEAALKDIDGVVDVTSDGPNRYRLNAKSDIRSAVAKRLVERGANLLRLNVIEPSLDEIYARYFESHRVAA
jgi:ABC-2 type transport system ATP-binding protein